MPLSGGVIAGIAIAGSVVILVLIIIVWYLIRKQRQRAEYEEKCGRLWKKYSQDVVGSNHPPETTYLHTPVAWQQLSPGEINMTSSSDFTVPLRPRSASDRVTDKLLSSMNEPIDPENIDPRLYTDQNTEDVSVSLFLGILILGIVVMQ